MDLPRLVPAPFMRLSFGLGAVISLLRLLRKVAHPGCVVVQSRIVIVPRMVWLASYPRSGNTLLRVILRDCFGAVVGSKYDERSGRPELRRLIGLDEGVNTRITKTHDHPENDAPALLSVRDGRACIVSYWHFLRDYASPAPLEDVIRGDVLFGSWSDHFNKWSQRPNTRVVKFEDFTKTPEVAIEAAAELLGRRPDWPFRKTFSELNAVDPMFFRSGCNETNIRELGGENLSLFFDVHGSLMEELDYHQTR